MSQKNTDTVESKKAQAQSEQKSEILPSQSPAPEMPVVEQSLLMDIVGELKSERPTLSTRANIIAIIAASHLGADLTAQHITGKDVHYDEIVEESTKLANMIIEAVYGPEVE